MNERPSSMAGPCGREICLDCISKLGFMAMWVQEIWRYPVKSMAGELLDAAELTEDGVEGDRIVQVRNRSGRILTARTKPALLLHRAALGPDGEPLVDGRPWRS